METLENHLFQGSVETVNGIEDMDRCLYQYKKHKKIVDRYTKERDELIQRVNLWLAEMTMDHLAAMHTLEELLKEYFIKQLSENPRLLCIQRPFGRFGVVHDEDGCSFQVDVNKE